jgi:hypothetical protein
MTDVASANRPVTRDDLESKLREVYGGAQEGIASTKNTIVSIGVVLGLVLLVITFLLGVRGGKKKTTIVEIRRV